MLVAMARLLYLCFVARAWATSKKVVVDQVGSFLAREVSMKSDRLQKLHDLVATLDTQTWTDNLTDVIAGILVEIDSDILGEVKKEHKDTQTHISNQVGIMTATREAQTEAFGDAQTTASNENDCYNNEKVSAGLFAANKTLLDNAATDEGNKRQLRDNAAIFTTSFPDLTWQCDANDKNCTAELVEINKSVAEKYQDAVDHVADKKTNWTAAVGVWQTADSTKSDRQDDTNDASQAYQIVVRTCKAEYPNKTRQDICSWTSAVNASCNAWKLWETLQDTVLNNTGSPWSAKDRQEEYQAVETVKCILNNYQVVGGGGCEQKTFDLISDNADVSPFDWSTGDNTEDNLCPSQAVTFRTEDYALVYDSSSVPIQPGSDSSARYDATKDPDQQDYISVLTVTAKTDTEWASISCDA